MYVKNTVQKIQKNKLNDLVMIYVNNSVSLSDSVT